jgi:hypothetical protein
MIVENVRRFPQFALRRGISFVPRLNGEPGLYWNKRGASRALVRACRKNSAFYAFIIDGEKTVYGVASEPFTGKRWKRGFRWV